MIEEVGTVLELRGGVALVRTERSSACEGCGSARFCNLSDGDHECTVEADNPSRAGVGQKVRIAIPTSSFLKGTFFLYLFPLVGLFCGMTGGHFLGVRRFPGHEELAAGLGALLGLLLFFLLQRLVDGWFERDRRYRPVIIDIL